MKMCSGVLLSLMNSRRKEGDQQYFAVGSEEMRRDLNRTKNNKASPSSLPVHRQHCFIHATV